MIYARFKRNDQQIQAFQLSGHADYSEEGSDIVCSAVSAVAIGTLNNLERLLQIDGKVVANHKDGGFLSYELPKELEADQMKKAQLLLEAFYYTLKDIEDEYADFLCVEK